MKTGFEDPLGEKKQKKLNSPWNFDCPPYDERSSCYVNAGTHHGVGHRQPVGHPGNPKKEVSTYPQDCRKVKTMKDDEVPHRNLRIEIDQ